jgi:hypothetical protein
MEIKSGPVNRSNVNFSLHLSSAELGSQFGIQVSETSYGIFNSVYGLRVYSVHGITLDVVPAGMGTTDF